VHFVAKSLEYAIRVPREIREGEEKREEKNCVKLVLLDGPGKPPNYRGKIVVEEL